ncbi:septum site-determining protein MinD [Fusobacterium periodonticum]|uniref:Septum site-determining protein MinD n=1 Tax=Fusobacterium periodonticum ATCC 33693 TaxID=546275 RepID=D4CU84_9FUSO|nr:septum site-determining protein MinD [Fusobacterium periodonticum]EFE87035.1 septum site-determining protein MinD [Fusobacterium periodonticum ATCC 33693]
MGARVIVITSGKGGVGKTTTTANIGAALADKGHKILLIDTDIGLRNLDVVMGLENRIVYDLIDVIEGRCRVSQALIKDKRCQNLVLLPAAQIRDKNDVNTDQMKELIFSLKESFDYILIDCPAGIEQGFKNAIVAADEAIVVTTPEVSATRDADRIIGLLEAAGIKSPRLVVNRLRIDMVKDKNMLGVEDILDILAVKLLGVVPDDENVVISTNKGEPLVYKGDSLAAKAFKNIASRIEGIEVPLLDLDVKMSILEKIKFVLKR